MNALLLSPEELAKLIQNPIILGRLIHQHERAGTAFLFHDWSSKLHEALTGVPTGGDPPLAWAVHGGQALESGGVHALALTHPQVRAIDKALREVGEQGLRRLVRQRLEARDVWTDGVDQFDYMVSRIMPAYRSVALVYGQAAKEGFAVVKWIT